MLNQVQFTYKRFAKVSARASINQYGRFKILKEITPTLIRHGVLQDFAATCFGHFLRFDSRHVFSSILVHNLLVRETTFDSARDFELWFGICQHRLRFFKYDFCLLTGLKFKKPVNIPAYNNNVIECGVHQRYWPSLKVGVTVLKNWLCETDKLV